MVVPDVFRDGAVDENRILEAFELPAGVSAPASLFVIPFDRRQVAVVSVLGRRFRFLVLPSVLYDVIPDPFAIVAKFPPNMDLTGTPPYMAPEVLDRRPATVADIIEVNLPRPRTAELRVSRQFIEIVDRIGPEFAPEKVASVVGNSSSDEAKIAGITPAGFTLIGKCDEPPS